ncbi:hypothetical protein K490DRAFT_42714 [Saccharata proteae CBS 121410]|uniref:N-acetylglucosamine-induced protein 1 n=1 Tax=Saccharata proteae CBS 121410 TaxID=1314787 RepID=A0A9P4HWW5_9PEZI|nr:hypothetical protein K490DRAFT_42714 [Saccharata proteae CBS 121410]
MAADSRETEPSHPQTQPPSERPPQTQHQHPNLTALDQTTHSQTSPQHTPHTWSSLRTIIAHNDLHLLTRSPSQLQAYAAWSASTAAQHGTITHTSATRTPSTPPQFAVQNPTPFASPSDYLVLPNDWPYSLAPGIEHLLIWLKTPLSLNPATGDLSDAARGLVEEFVTKYFRQRLGEAVKGEKVLWFKNWTALQSVRGVDHVHILIRDVDSSDVEELYSRRLIGT